MKTLVYCTVLLWFLFIPSNFVFAADTNDISYREIYDIYHKQKYKVSIQEDPAEEKIILNLLDNNKILDSKSIINAAEVTQSETLSDTFLAVMYRVRGGTGIGINMTQIFSIKRGKLFESLILETTYREDQDFGGKTLVDRYNALLILQGSSYKNFALHVKESEYLDDKMKDRPRHEDWKETFTIPFDLDEMIFTNGKATLNGEFIFVFFKTKIEEEKRQLNNKTVKRLAIKTQEFLHIDGKWFARGRGKRSNILSAW